MFLDEFFRVNTEVELPARKGKKEKIIVRTLSDVEMQARSDYALSEQARVYAETQNPESDIYKANIAPLEQASDEILINAMADILRVDSIREANELFRIDFYPYPDNATDEEKRETLDRQKKHEEDIYGQRLRLVASREESARKHWADLSHDVLLKNARAAVTRLYPFKASVEAELYFTISRACETLDGNPKWTIEQVKKLSGKMVDSLMAKYREVDAIDPWELTKSQPQGNVGGVEPSDSGGGGDEQSTGS